MKKDEIDDRLMDALLRGESQEDLVNEVVERNAAKIRKGNMMRTIFAIAAMVVFAAIGVSVLNQSKEKVEDGLVKVDSAVEDKNQEELASLVSKQGMTISPDKSDSSRMKEMEDRPAQLEQENGMIRPSLGSSFQVSKPQELAFANNEELFGSSDDYGTGWVGGGSTDSNGVQEKIRSRTPIDPQESIGSTALELEQQVVVAGMVNKPGGLSYIEGMTLEEAVLHAGGPSTFGTTKRVNVYREGKKYSLNFNNPKHKLERLYPGDTVEVDQVKSWESQEGSDSFGRTKDSGEMNEVVKMRGLTKKLSQLEGQNEAIANQNAEKYGELIEQSWKSPRKEALSTFSIDVDTASYTNLRRLLKDLSLIHI